MSHTKKFTCLFLLLSVGCQPSVGNRVPIQGTVTLDGSPIAAATVVLTPAEGQSGPAAAGEIADGAFSIPAAQGPALGDYVATISVPRMPKKDQKKDFPGKRDLFDVDKFHVAITVDAPAQSYTWDLPREPRRSRRRS